jgi:superfamily II DNA helicase RecQ
MAKTIFTDGQLGELVKSLPCDKRSFIQVTAIDNAKFEQFGQGFLKHCREYSDKVGELPSS